MSGITLEQAQAQLNIYLAGEAAILKSQSYKIDGRELVRADLRWVLVGVETWNKRVINLSNRAAGNRRNRTIVVGA